MKTLQLGMGWFPEQPGGLNRFYYNCTHHLPQVGIEMYGLVAGSNAVRMDSHGYVQVFAPRESSLLTRWRGLRRSVRQTLQVDDPALVASHFALYTFPVLDQLGDRPLVMHFHGPWALEGCVEGNLLFTTRLKKVLEQITYRRATHFIVLSQAFREILHQVYQVPLQQIHIIPSGIDIAMPVDQPTRAQAREKLGWAQDRTIVFAVRRLAHRMGLENLIRSIAEVRLFHPDILLLIGGKGLLMPVLQKLIDELDIQDYVKLLGFVPDHELGLAYRAANCSIVPTVALEGFGLTVLESLAAGTPVLGTPVGGIPEILRPLSEDLVLAGSTAEDLSDGIHEALIGDRSLPDQVVCQDYVRQNYSWQGVAQQIKAVYQTALAGGTA
ncbi:MAG: glycosyltransferase family 4 protein [Scytolyngbya sp. HA4215-MV1]|jgi:glycosyltransferase involved in cell wall biosynthesis|nr:glycosyltransferase family 4 protein [Scytolyngbya sp. HA4215-MV1]